MSKLSERQLSPADTNVEGFKQALSERREEMVESLSRNDFGQVAELIRQINHIRDETLYREVGRLTRGLHNALRDFHLNIGLGGDSALQHELSEMVDARSRLNYVIRMTEDAANRTMDKVDESVPMLQGLIRESDELSAEWAQQSGVGQVPLVDRTQRLLARVSTEGANVTGNLSDILVAQGFQDLSGQVIERVITLVTDIEGALVRLVKLAANVELVAGIAPPLTEPELTGQEASAASKDAALRGEGPQFRTADRAQVVSGQDDVDEWLSSLGC